MIRYKTTGPDIFIEGWFENLASTSREDITSILKKGLDEGTFENIIEIPGLSVWRYVGPKPSDYTLKYESNGFEYRLVWSTRQPELPLQRKPIIFDGDKII